MKLEHGTYIREFIFGVEDGLVSTLGFVVGLTTAAVSNKIIIFGGVVEMITAAISMAAGTYLSIKSQREFFEAREKKKNKHLHLGNPRKGAIVMFISFIIGALVPITPFFFSMANKAIIVAAFASIIALFFFGAVKTKLTKRSWVKGGLEMAVVGLIASLAGFLIGIIAKNYLGI